MNEREGTRDTENGQDPASLERDIDRTRASLGQTVDALQSRLSPGELLDQALGMARQHGGEFATNLGRSVRNNPVPVILTGVGLAWMMASSNEPRAAGTYGEYEDYSSQGSGATDRLKSGVSSAKSAAGAVTDTASRATQSLKQSIGSLGDSASGAGQRIRSESRRVKHGFESLMEEQPLMLGALGLAIGAALGAAFPRTESEDRLLGDRSDSAMRSVKEKATDAFAEVKDTAAEVVASKRDKVEGARSGDRMQAQEPLTNGTPAPESREPDWRSARGDL